jgi:hypothetical protein
MFSVRDRLLLDPHAPDAQSYRIYRVEGNGLRLVAAFRTGGVNGKSADDTAIGNLADLSEHGGGEHRLFRDCGVFSDRLLARATAGVYQVTS